MKPTPRQVEFREKLTALLTEHAEIVGPQFDGDEEGEQAQMPVPTAWVLAASWTDIAGDDDDQWTVSINSGCSRATRVGLLRLGLDMALGD
jgi:hypothetical protein